MYKAIILNKFGYDNRVISKELEVHILTVKRWFDPRGTRWLRNAIRMERLENIANNTIRKYKKIYNDKILNDEYDNPIEYAQNLKREFYNKILCQQEDQQL